MRPNNQSNIGKLLTSFHWLIGLMPGLWLISLYTYAIRAKNILGYWPSPYHPDPKTKILADAIGMHYKIASGLGHIAFVSIIPLLIFIPILKSFNSRKNLIVRTAICVLLWLLALSLIYFDPGRFHEWYLD